MEVFCAFFTKNFGARSSPFRHRGIKCPEGRTFSPFLAWKRFPLCGNITRVAENYRNLPEQKNSSKGPGPEMGKWRCCCGKIKLFHILHRFFHRGFPQENPDESGRTVNIIFYDGLRQNSTFSAIVFFTRENLAPEKKDLTEDFKKIFSKGIDFMEK